MEKWKDGMMEEWKNGRMECWNVGRWEKSEFLNQNLNNIIMKIRCQKSLLFLISILLTSSGFSQNVINLNSEEFTIVNGKITEHLGREALMGTGYIADVEFTNGIIEIDMAVTGARSYPGIFFRQQSPSDYEHLYIRPHRGGLYPDAVQYTPCTNGIGSWQLFNGAGYTSGATFPKNEWFHVRLEIKGNRAMVFIEDNPVLDIFELYHPEKGGGISLNSPANGSAYFSNLSYTITDDILFPEAPVPDPPIGMLTSWEISNPFTMLEISMDKTPEEQNLPGVVWQKVEADKNGLVDIALYHGRQSNAPDVVYCKINIEMEKDSIIELKYGYSDAVVLFLNGQPIVNGSSAYTERDPSFLGIIGLFDAVYLPLKKGNNEIMLAVAESFGGWGLMCRFAEAVYLDNNLQKVWETEKVFKVSESIVYDPKREALYVTNFDQFNMRNPEVSQSISKISLSGEIIELDWTSGLSNPLGMTIYKDDLYVTERKSIAKIKLKTGEITQRFELPGSLFPNDIAIDDKGIIYVSDSRKNVIWRITNGIVDEWLVGEDVIDPNVLYFHEGKVLFGNSGDSWLKSVDPESKTIEKIAKFPEGFIDGIRPDGKGNLLVSLWKGKIYKVDPEGNTNLIFHTENQGKYSADFEYIPDKNMLIVPTFYSNTVAAYKYK